MNVYPSSVGKCSDDINAPKIQKNNKNDSNSLKNSFISAFEEVGLDFKMSIIMAENYLVSNYHVIGNDDTD